MDKIVVANPVVELDGDEMTRIIWKKIREELILPYIQLDIKYFDLGLEYRDETNDQGDGGRREGDPGAQSRHQVRDDHPGRAARGGVQAEGDVEEPEWDDPQHPRRDRLPRAHHPQPHPPSPSPAGSSPSSLGDMPLVISTAQQTSSRPGPASCRWSTPPRTARPATTLDVYDFVGRGVALCMYNTDESITGFAHSSFKMALAKKMPLFMSTKNTILKKYDGRFKDIFQEIYEEHYKPLFDDAAIYYEHRLIDDMVAQAIKSSGGFVWATKNYDGDVQSDILAQGFGSLGMMTSELITPDGQVIESEAAHGTVTRHYREYQKGNETSTNPVASIFAWTRGLLHRAKLDGNAPLRAFCEALEAACVEVIDQDGVMTKDLALAIHGRDMKREHWVITDVYMDKVKAKLQKKLDAGKKAKL
ncbi:hypothetical protein B0H14DRAFT_2902986 [Mycena olivaceomarginata]|nr:hypothetical protein B0H14DRAFT_2902986 [Mycena olivaceomarginata]